jgi:hypothetical protein
MKSRYHSSVASKIVRKTLLRTVPVSLSLILLLEAHPLRVNHPHSLDSPEISATEKHGVKIMIIFAETEVI